MEEESGETKLNHLMNEIMAQVRTNLTEQFLEKFPKEAVDEVFRPNSFLGYGRIECYTYAIFRMYDMNFPPASTKEEACQSAYAYMLSCRESAIRQTEKNIQQYFNSWEKSGTNPFAPQTEFFGFKNNN